MAVAALDPQVVPGTVPGGDPRPRPRDRGGHGEVGGGGKEDRTQTQKGKKIHIGN